MFECLLTLFHNEIEFTCAVNSAQHVYFLQQHCIVHVQATDKLNVVFSRLTFLEKVFFFDEYLSLLSLPYETFLDDYCEICANTAITKINVRIRFNVNTFCRSCVQLAHSVTVVFESVCTNTKYIFPKVPMQDFAETHNICTNGQCFGLFLCRTRTY